MEGMRRATGLGVPVAGATEAGMMALIADWYRTTRRQMAEESRADSGVRVASAAA